MTERETVKQRFKSTTEPLLQQTTTHIYNNTEKAKKAKSDFQKLQKNQKICWMQSRIGHNTEQNCDKIKLLKSMNLNVFALFPSNNCFSHL